MISRPVCPVLIFCRDLHQDVVISAQNIHN
jgi:hypothetical protein